MKNTLLILIITGLFPFYNFSQDQVSKTLPYNDSIGSPKANLSHVEWIQGHWRGEAFGGIVEEIWSAPFGGSMMCVFKLVKDDLVRFYEIVTISEENETLILRLKHFDADLKGWEQKDETIDFKLVKLTENKAFFDGFTFEKLSENEMNIYLVIENNGENSEIEFNYKK